MLSRLVAMHHLLHQINVTRVFFRLMGSDFVSNRPKKVALGASDDALKVGRANKSGAARKYSFLLQNQRIYYRKPYRKPREIPNFLKSEGFTFTTNTLDGDSIEEECIGPLKHVFKSCKKTSGRAKINIFSEFLYLQTSL